MDLIYADHQMNEIGVLKHFEADFDTTAEKDFEIIVGIETNEMLSAGYYWYIEDTEYGGIIDRINVVTSDNEIKYSGRNFRGMLTKKIISPPAGQSYKTVSGNLSDIVSALISDAEFQDIFIVESCPDSVSSFKFDRYTDLYSGIVKLLASVGKLLELNIKDGKVHLSFRDAVDYSDENEYGQHDMNFNITKTYNNVNHLICLGQGELKDRTVLHLYADKNGKISEKKSIIGIDEVVDIYDNSAAESESDLKKGGITRLKELNNRDCFDVTVPDITLKIGDIIGGYEYNTGIYVSREIVNIIAKISDDRIEVEYKVGEDNASVSGSNSCGNQSVSSIDSIALEQEISRAKSRENSLETSINTNTVDIILEKKNRSTADKNLQEQITGTTTSIRDMKANLQSVSSNVSELKKEVNKKANSNDLTSEISRAKESESSLDTKILGETSRATKAESNLDAKIDTSYANSNAYTDKKIADLIGGAPTTLDTLKEIADAMSEQQTVVEALDNAIGSKANQVELDAHTENDVIHITASEREALNSTRQQAQETANNLYSLGLSVDADGYIIQTIEE